jgi:hypothetical protein
MKDRRQRRTLPACRYVGGAEIVDHRDVKPHRESPPVADLQREAPFRPVQQRLTVKTDDCHLATLQAVGRQEGFHSLGVGVVSQAFGFGDRVRPRSAVGQVGSRGGGAA